MSRSKSLLPFRSNLEYVESELRWLRARCARIAAQGRLEEVEQEEAGLDPTLSPRVGRTDSRLARCHLSLCQQEEDRLRAEIDTRLLAHRRTPNSPNLGLLQVERDYGISGDSRTVLLVALVDALGSQWKEHVFGSLLPSSTFSGLLVEEALGVVIGPVASDAESLERYLMARSLFWPATPLMRSGLIVVTGSGAEQFHAGSLMGSMVHATLRGLQAVLLAPDGLLREGGTADLGNGHE